MIHEYREPVIGSDTDEIVLGTATWAEGVDESVKSVKYAWPDSRGHMARGGEVPVSAIGQIIQAAVREGYLPAHEVLQHVAHALKARDGK